MATCNAPVQGHRPGSSASIECPVHGPRASRNTHSAISKPPSVQPEPLPSPSVLSFNYTIAKDVDALSLHEDWGVRLAAVCHANISDHALEAALNDEDPRVAVEALSKTEHISAGDTEMLYRHESEWVRSALMRRPDVPALAVASVIKSAPSALSQTLAANPGVAPAAIDSLFAQADGSPRGPLRESIMFAAVTNKSASERTLLRGALCDNVDVQRAVAARKDVSERALPQLMHADDPQTRRLVDRNWGKAGKNLDGTLRDAMGRTGRGFARLDSLHRWKMARDLWNLGIDPANKVAVEEVTSLSGFDDLSADSPEVLLVAMVHPNL